MMVPLCRLRTVSRRDGLGGRRGQGGATLVEVLAAAAVVAVVAAAGVGVMRLAAALSGRETALRSRCDAALELAWELRALPYVAGGSDEPSVVGRLFPHAVEGGRPAGGGGDGGARGFFVAERTGPWPGSCFVAFHATESGEVCTVAQFVRPAGGGTSAAAAAAGATPPGGASTTDPSLQGWTVVPVEELCGLALCEEPPALLRAEIRPARHPYRPVLMTLFFAADGAAVSGGAAVGGGAAGGAGTRDSDAGDAPSPAPCAAAVGVRDPAPAPAREGRPPEALETGGGR